MSTTTVRGTHLVGSLNLPDAETAIRSAAQILGGRLRRIPDGERDGLFHGIGLTTDALAFGSGTADLDAAPLGYARAAMESYPTFVALRAAGIVAAGTRFQVSLPTPIAIVADSADTSDPRQLERRVTARLFTELDELLAAIPHADLAIQWEVAAEFALVEGAGYRAPLAPWWADGWWDDAWSGVIERAIDLLGHVPADVETGFHLCYGDLDEKHFVEPADTGNLTRFVNAVARIAPRRIDWIHLPVPIERDDAGYFAPLADLTLDDATELYLGVVHREDGVSGARRRIEAASSVVRRFGVGTECGLGRAPQESVIPLLEVHRELAAAW